MRVDRVELIGFKSFSEKTVFSFHPGITAIVGPNGCGKSNIVDAFRWVLGEQSAKSLRGDHMEDVIFSGSSTKKPKGMAEVTLVVSDVNNGDLPGPGDVSVTRRLYRSGESEYLINKVPCRLKDIKNVFLDTGLELKTYSILEQGKIDVILNAKPHERRFLIEEVAGVMKYNVRKAEALQKLESSRSNLQRLQDIIAEVKRQINSIERYAKKAEKYKELFEEIKSIELRIAARDAAVLSDELGNVSEFESTFKLRETELSTRVSSADGLIEEKKLLLSEKEKSFNDIRTELHSSERALVEEEGRVSLLKNDCANLRGRAQRLISRSTELVSEQESIIFNLGEIGQKDTEMEKELLNIETSITSLSERLSAMEQEFADSEHELEALRKHIFHKAEEISNLKNEINSLLLTKEVLSRKESKNLEDIDSIKNEISSHTALLKEAGNEYDALDVQLKDKYKVKDVLYNDVVRKKQELTAKEETLYRDREEQAALVSRSGSLKEMDASRRASVDSNIKILCQVADILEPLPEYETAIEAALGDKLNVSVVNNYQEIQKALEFIREQHIDRSGFIPADISAVPLSRNQALSALPSGAVLGKALDFVRVKKGFNNIASLLLNDVVIVDNLNIAFELWHKSLFESPADPGYRYFVTRGGEVLEPSGIVFGGIEKSILRIKREIRELEKNIEDKKTIISRTEEEVVSLKNDISSAENQSSSLNSEISGMERNHHELQLKIAGVKEENVRLQKKVEYLSAELEDDKKEKEKISQDLNAKSDCCRALENEKLAAAEGINSVQKGLEEKKVLLGELRSELTGAMLSRTSIKEKRDYIAREKERLNLKSSDIEKKKEEISAERIEIEGHIKNKEEEIVKKEETLKSFVITIADLQKKSAELKEVIEARNAELNLLEKQQKANMDELSSVRKEIAKIDVKKTELALKLTHIKEDIKRTYSVDVDRTMNEGGGFAPLLPEDEERLPILKERLQNMGPVNLGTLEELEELKTRFDFLTKQQGDILQSIISLEGTIAKINNTTRKKLTDAFEALNEKFKDVFTTLFGKGRAEIILTEGSILEAGIDIVAQPPGKKLQNLMLLSGGEKALTAISLLFAGFMIKPTPLCLLDEVDAPLDESNTERFTSLLTGLSKNIQFITITHNRRTMEVADYIYGVTMEEPGVSKVVSMHMAEAV